MKTGQRNGRQQRRKSKARERGRAVETGTVTPEGDRVPTAVPVSPVNRVTLDSNAPGGYRLTPGGYQ